jgi:Rho GTPase-activating protein RGD1
MDSDRLQLVKIHELVNALDDLHYGTLKVLAKHLSVVSQSQHLNKMSSGNLGIVWGPNLMDSGLKVDATDLQYSARVVEVIINNVDNLFEFDE